MPSAAPPDAPDLDAWLAAAVEIATKAAEMVRDGQAARWIQSAEDSDNDGPVTEQKKNRVDLVTETDQKVERYIQNEVKQRFGSQGHLFIGEETLAELGEGNVELTEAPTWIVDPIDGTLNFCHSQMTLIGLANPLLVAHLFGLVDSPAVGVSIGIAINREPVVGVVALPFLNQIFSARRGGGAFMNTSTPLPLTAGVPQPLESLSDAVLTAEWGSDRSPETIAPKARTFAKLVGEGVAELGGESGPGKMCHAVRTTGASTVNLVQVAAGQLDIYFDTGAHIWDVCAGMCILHEAGGLSVGGPASFARLSTPRQDTLGDIMLSSRYCFVRGLRPPKGKAAREHQLDLVRELYEVVEPWTNQSMRAREGKGGRWTVW